MAYSGKFKVKNIKKYKGDFDNMTHATFSFNIKKISKYFRLNRDYFLKSLQSYFQLWIFPRLVKLDLSLFIWY